MNKKVLSAILFSALFAGTGTFTSCIDNDEPAGIEELRGAKAELLRAKVAVEQAQASLTLAQAEVEKAKAAKKLAEAEISEAQARLDNAKAEAAEAATEVAKAMAEAKIAEIQQKMDTLALAHQTAMLEMKQSLALAQRDYDVMLAQIEIAKAVGSSESYVTISELQQKVRRAQFKVNRALEGVEEAEGVYNFAVAYEETHGELNAKKIESMLADAEEELADAQADLALWEGYLANAESADWAKEIKALDDSLAAIKKDTVELNLAIAKALQSDSLVALQAAATEAAKPATADSVYGYKYFGAENATTLHVEGDATVLKACATATEEAAKKAVVNEASLNLIAQYNNAEELIDGQLYDDKKYLASFTTEVKFFLDTIAAGAKVDTSYLADIKAWKDTLAIYKGLDTKTDIEGLKTKAQNALTKYFANTAKAKVAADSLLAYYNAAEKNGLALGNVPVKSYSVDGAGKVTASYSLEGLKTVLADTIKTAFVLDSVYKTSAPFFAVGKTAAKFNGKDYKSDGVLTALDLNAGTCEAALVRCSDKAFGKAENYLTDFVAFEDMVDKQGGYLNNQPTEADMKALYTYYGLTDVLNNVLGSYGKYLYTKEPANITFAKNYKSIMADLEAAIAYWEATYKTLSTKYTAWDAAKKAADDAVANYEDTVTEPMKAEIKILAAKAERIANVQEALRVALAAYLPETYKGLPSVEATETLKDDLQLFVLFLEAAIDEAEEDVEEAEHNLADAKLMATLIENGESFVEKAQAELDEAIANLEAKQAKLDEALANLAKGLEIIAAVNAAE